MAPYAPRVHSGNDVDRGRKEKGKRKGRRGYLSHCNFQSPNNPFLGPLVGCRSSITHWYQMRLLPGNRQTTCH